VSGRQQQLLQQPPKVLMGRLMGQLVPVEFAVQRDTWLAWRRGALAVTPVSGAGRTDDGPQLVQ
jgi:hypothetical protein